MRGTVLFLFLGTGVAAMCQSIAPAPRQTENAGGSLQRARSSTDCKATLPDFSTLTFATLKGEPPSGVPETWNRNNGQADAKKMFHYPFAGADAQLNAKNPLPASPSNSLVPSCAFVAQNWQPGLYAMPFPEWPNAKLIPIPTQWPDAKFEPIPTQWPNLKRIPIASQLSTTPQVP